MAASVENALECLLGILVGIPSVLRAGTDRRPVFIAGKIEIDRQQVVDVRFEIAGRLFVDALCQQGQLRRPCD